MNYLVTVWDAGGSVPPELALVRRLVEHGHPVVVLAGPPLRPAVEAVGATFRPWRDVPHRAEADDPDPFTDTGLPGPKIVQLLLDRVAAGPAGQYAREVGEALDAHGCSALVSSMLMLGGLAAAEARAIPHAVVLPNCYLLPTPGMPPFGMSWPPARGRLGQARIAAMNALATRLWDRGLPRFNAVRHDLGLGPLRHLFDQHRSAARVLVLTAQAFDFPADLPANVHYVGPQLDDPHWATDDRATLHRSHLEGTDLLPPGWPEGDDPMVLVGMSTTDMGHAGLLRRVVTALEQLPVRGLVTTGPGIDPADVPGTRRVAVMAAAPHTQVLPHTSAVISHGGHGTVVKTLAAGLPQLVIPLGRDQPNNAVRITHRGAGLQLRASASPQTIATAVDRLLRDKEFTRRASRLGATVRAEATHSTALDHLEALTLRPDHEPAPRTAPASPPEVKPD